MAQGPALPAGDQARRFVPPTSTSPGGGEPVARTTLHGGRARRRLPAGAIEWALGVGNPVRHAELRSGETVLDLGCGGGVDTILAAHEVGPTGRAIGIDLLDEMVERATANAREAGVAAGPSSAGRDGGHPRCRTGSVDVVISNGVINLSPRKSRVFAEVLRVLRPGGRLCVADLTVEEDLRPRS